MMYKETVETFCLNSANSLLVTNFGLNPTSKENPLTCYLISCEVKGVVYHQASDQMLGGTLLP